MREMIGILTAAVLAFFIMPILGWRWLFAIGALPGLRRDLSSVKCSDSCRKNIGTKNLRLLYEKARLHPFCVHRCSGS